MLCRCWFVYTTKPLNRHCYRYWHQTSLDALDIFRDGKRTIKLATLLLVPTLIFIILSAFTSVGTPRETLFILSLKTTPNTLSFSIRQQNNKNSMAPMLESWIIQQHPVSTHITSLLFIRYLATLFGYLHFIGCRKNISDTLWLLILYPVIEIVWRINQLKTCETYVPLNTHLM